MKKKFPKTISIQKLKLTKLLTFAARSTSTPYTNRANPACLQLQVCVATVPMENSGEVSAAYATDPSARLKEGHSIAARKTNN